VLVETPADGGLEAPGERVSG